MVSSAVIFLCVLTGLRDPCVLDSLWRGGVPLRVVGSVGAWWARVENLTYLEASQHVLVGGVSWLTSVMAKVRPFYDAFKINAQKTRWFWVASDCPAPPPLPPLAQGRLPSTSPLPPPSAPLSFSEICGRVSRVLEESVKGVLLVHSGRLASSENETEVPADTWVAIAGVQRSGDGSSQLEFVASWSAAGLESYKPIWPQPPFDFMNKTVRIACIKKPQVFEFEDGASLDSAGGYIVEILKVIRGRHNFTGVLVPTEGFGLRTPNGSYNGMVGVVQRKEADMAALDFTPSLARTEVVDFSIPIGEDIVVIISRAPDILIRPFLLLQIFSPLSWLAILASAISVGVVTWIVGVAEAYVGGERSKGAISLTEQVVAALMIHVYQGSPARPRSPAAHLVGVTGMLVALVIGSLYCGSVTAFLAIPFRSLPVDSVEVLARSSIRPALRSKTLVLETLTAEGGALHEVRDEVGVFTDAEMSSWSFFESVADGTYALVDVYSSAVGRAMQYERRGERCRFYLGKEPVKVDLDVFVFAKNSPILFQIDDTIRWLKYFGVIQHIKKNYYSVPCEVEVTSNAPEPMSLLQSQGAFYVLGAGLALATASFLLEVAWRAFVRREDDQVAWRTFGRNEGYPGP
ncbi:glutamate receptor U1 isoform X2 [Penaeus vannamei]|uniref:glutamate receptor U1 isoform X2 n=1 Tax=Penaeus vannamei TaxID=6689 RepID=UPI00387F3D84